MPYLPHSELWIICHITSYFQLCIWHVLCHLFSTCHICHNYCCPWQPLQVFSTVKILSFTQMTLGCFIINFC